MLRFWERLSQEEEEPKPCGRKETDGVRVENTPMYREGSVLLGEAFSRAGILLVSRAEGITFGAKV